MSISCSRPAADSGKWVMYGGTVDDHRYSSLNQINEQTVPKLGLAWSREVGTTRGLEATPLVENGVIYTTSSWSVVYALDAKTGEVRWNYDPKVPRERAYFLCCDVVNRGVALHNGKVYVGTLDARLIALEAKSGNPVWSVMTGEAGKPYSITGYPRIAKNLVVIGNAGSEYGVRGYVSAYDAETGKMVWRTYTVPGDPKRGFESQAMEAAAKTWSGEWWTVGGGGTAWEGIVYDPSLDMLYFGTGNASAWYRALRGDGKGDNLYTASIVALRAANGELAWSFQPTPGDNWDYDATQPLMQADLNIGGRQRKVIMQANKNGFFYVLDRVTGEFISAQPFSRVTWAMGIDQKTGRPIINTEVKYGKDPVPVSPGGGGAHNWSPMSYNPQTGLVYVPTRGWDTFTYAVNYDFKADPTRVGGASQTGLNMNTAGMTRKPSGPAIGPEPLEGGNLSTLVAYDPVKQEIRWRVPVGNSRYGGTLSTASNLVFQVAPDGRLIAYSGDKGEKLFETASGLRYGMGPPITFMVDGKQYIALMGGNGGAPSPGQTGAPAGAAPSPVKPRLMVYGLDGKAEVPKPAAAPTSGTADPHQQ